MRLGKLAIEYNLNTSFIHSYLCDKGFSIPKNLNSMIPEEAVKIIELDFAQSKLDKQKTKEITFIPNESNDFHIEIEHRCKLFNLKIPFSSIKKGYIEKFGGKIVKYYDDYFCKDCNESLSFEIYSSSDVLLNNCSINNIDDLIELLYPNDEDFEENISEKDDIYGDFSWGGLIGQEAYDAMWNCD